MLLNRLSSPFLPDERCRQQAQFGTRQRERQRSLGLALACHAHPQPPMAGAEDRAGMTVGACAPAAAPCRAKHGARVLRHEGACCFHVSRVVRSSHHSLRSSDADGKVSVDATKKSSVHHPVCDGSAGHGTSARRAAGSSAGRGKTSRAQKRPNAVSASKAQISPSKGQFSYRADGLCTHSTEGTHGAIE
jgi:hypothetical protein